MVTCRRRNVMFLYSYFLFQNVSQNLSSYEVSMNFTLLISLDWLNCHDDFTHMLYLLGYSLFCEGREKWLVISRKFQKKKLKQHFFYPSDLVNTKTTIPLRVVTYIYIYRLLHVKSLISFVFTSF